MTDGDTHWGREGGSPCLETEENKQRAERLLTHEWSQPTGKARLEEFIVLPLSEKGSPSVFP